MAGVVVSLFAALSSMLHRTHHISIIINNNMSCSLTLLSCSS
jgi:hypothetical protein